MSARAKWYWLVGLAGAVLALGGGLYYWAYRNPTTGLARHILRPEHLTSGLLRWAAVEDDGAIGDALYILEDEVGAAAVPVLVAHLGASDARVQAAALDALAGLLSGAGWETESDVPPESFLAPVRLVVPALIDCLDCADPYSRCNAIWVLSYLRDGEAAPAVPKLIECLEDPDENVRDEALGVFFDIGPCGLPALPHIADRIVHEPERVVAVNAMLELAGDAETIRTLLERTQDEEPMMREAAWDGIGTFCHDPQVIRLAAEALRDPYAPAREQAAEVLEHLSSCVPQTVPALAEALKPLTADRDEVVRRIASTTLANVLSRPKALDGLAEP